MLPPLIIIALCLITFWPVGDLSFINFDDNVYLTANPEVLRGLDLVGVKWAFTTTLGGHWHPLSWISHMIDVSLFGLSPRAHHFVNLFFHTLNATLVYALLQLHLKNRRVALFSALIFALHPLRLESVAWVTERKDVLSLSFGLGATIAYHYFRTLSLRRYQVYALILFAASLLAKPTLVTLPVLLALLDFWPGSRVRFTASSPYSLMIQLGRALICGGRIPFFILSILSGVISIYSQALGGGLRTVGDVSLLNRFEVAIVGYLIYLGKLFYPFEMAVFYPMFNPISGLATGALIGLGAISLTLWRARTQNPWLLFGWLWFLISLLPMIGLVSVGGQFVADRWTYWPHIGIVVALVFHLTRQNRQSVDIVIVSVILLLALFTNRGLNDWRDSESLFKRALAIEPNNFLAHTNLGVALAESGRIDEALYHYEEAVRLHPNYPEALNNLGTLRAQSGRFEAAIWAFDKALAIRPDFNVARQNRAQALIDLERNNGRR